jgi:SAM-dependent methyltransferase
MKEEIIPQLHGPDIIEGHLGGCSIGGDGGTYYPIMWKYLIDNYNVKTVLDIGCGRGYSAKYFESIGCDILGIDGSMKAQEMSLIPEHFLLNDYETGPALSRSEIKYNDKPLDDFIFDLCWCCEFVEHVWEEYSQNFLDDFKRCKYVAMTFAYPGQTGHHHVNENTQEYWVDKLKNNGFEYLESQTNDLREKSNEDVTNRLNDPESPFFEPHFLTRGLFFKNNNFE